MCEVVKYERVARWGGHMLRFTLACGHVVERNTGNARPRTQRMHCPVCRP